MDCSEEVGCGFKVSGCDASEVFEAVEEALDHVALSVEFGIDRADDADIALTGDVGRRTGCLYGCGHVAPEVAAVGNSLERHPR